MRDYTYIAVSAKRENKPWMLLREYDRQLCRWVPHLQRWVRMSGHWDWLSGFSSDSLTVDARTVTKAEAFALCPTVRDLSTEDVERYKDRRQYWSRLVAKMSRWGATRPVRATLTSTSRGQVNEAPMSEPEYEYFVHDYRGTPRMLLRTRTYQCFRWIPYLQEWVEMPGHWDYISGHSSSSFGTRRLPEEEAMTLRDVVVDLPDELVDSLRPQA